MEGGDDAVNAAGQKLRSQRGASITYALLIFLVCAVVSSIVIVAGTTAAGRMSNLAESDQRYYAVTSAAGLLQSALCTDKKVRLEYNRGTREIARVTYEDGTAVEDPLLKDTTERLIKSDSTRAFALSPETAVENAKLSCNIAETVQPGGLATFDVSSDDGSGKNVYTLRITFAANTKKTVSATDPDTDILTVEWTLHSIGKVRKTSA